MGRGAKGKIAVVGVVQRGGMVVARVVDRVDGRTLTQFIGRAVSPKADLLSTDDYQGYPAWMPFPRGVVNHSKHEYVVGPVHTNTIEGFWSLFKRGMRAVYSHASRPYLQSYGSAMTGGSTPAIILIVRPELATKP